MARMHIHIAVGDIETNIRFYTALFGTGPAVHKPDYAKWELDDPAVNFAISTHGGQRGLDHVGIQTASGEELAGLQARLTAAGVTGTPQENAACCYARSDKYWTLDPQGIAWEAFHTLDSIPTFSDSEAGHTGESCCVAPGLADKGCCP